MQNKIDKKLHNLTLGLRLTQRQRQSIYNQLLKGVKEPVLQIHGVKLTLKELETTQWLLRQRQQLDKTVKKGAPRAPKLKKVSGGYVNQYGVFISESERKEYQNLAKRINEYIKKQQFIETAHSVRELARLSKGKPSRLSPSMAAAQIFAPVSGMISNFKSREKFEETLAKYKEKYNPQTHTSIVATKIYQAYKDNWLKSYIKSLDIFAEYYIIEKVEVAEPYQFWLATRSGIVPDIPSLYASNIDDANALNDRILQGLQFSGLM